MTALLIIIAVLVVIFVIPIGVTVKYCDGDFSAALRVMVFDFTVLGGEEEVEEVPKKEKKPKKKKKKEPGEQEGKKSLSFSKSELIELLKLGIEALRRFRRKLVINNFKLLYVSADRDPCEAARAYGYVNTALGLLTAPGNAAFNVRRSDVRTAVDFERTEPYMELDVTVTVNLAKLIGIGLWAAAGFIRIKKQSAKEKSREVSAEERTDEDGSAVELPDGRADAGQHEQN